MLKKKKKIKKIYNPVWFPVTGWMWRQTVFKCRDQQQQLLLTGCLCTPDQSGASSTETPHARSKTSEFLPEMMRTRTKSALSALELGIKRVGHFFPPPPPFLNVSLNIHTTVPYVIAVA